MRANLTDAEKYAYTAGVFDGEGCISIKKININKSVYTQYKPRLQVGSTDRKLINWLHATFGGCIYECSNKRHPTWKEYCLWELYNKEAVTRLIEGIYPYLNVKLPQAQTMLFFLNRDTLDTGQRWSDEMHRLNKKGRDESELSEDE